MGKQIRMNEKERTRRLTVMGLLCAVAYVIVAVCRIPIVSFLKYEPKDVVIVIGGFLYGPLASFAISAVVSLVEMLTVSETGFYGLLMNILSSCAFAGTAAFVYTRRHTLRGAICGLLAGTVLMTLFMLLWNYIITPMYMGMPREAIVKMLPTVFLPFNAFKGGLNAALTLLLYKPLMRALRLAHLVPEDDAARKGTSMWNAGTLLAAAVLVITCVLILLAVKRVI